ncbi:MAG: discoidin domain-containing protein [Chloroflexi bacterium]|nr:discoidin domain-containing protein [Chloroflexota bacterium]
MTEPRQSAIRKRKLPPASSHNPTTGELDIPSSAVIAYSSEDPAHPVDNLFDGRDGPGGTRWLSARPNVTEQILLEFDEPRGISRLSYQVEETSVPRTQEIRVEASTDGGQSYRNLLVQEYTFSPNGATFQREDLQLPFGEVSHLRLTIVPNKHGSGVATLTSLRLFN